MSARKIEQGAFRMNKITKKLLKAVSDFSGEFKGAYNIREDEMCIRDRKKLIWRLQALRL